MKKFLLSAALVLISLVSLAAQETGMRSIQEYGVLPGNTPEQNKAALQKAIDEASASGTALYVTPAEQGYKVASGIVLKRNVSLIGAHGPLGRGSRNEKGTAPVGSLFLITDADAPFITCESSTQIRGIQFYYPQQDTKDPSKVIRYPATISLDKKQNLVECVTMSSLSFYGEWEAIDCVMPEPNICEQILCEHCYGYPLSGKFFSIDRCYDIPRVLHCHINPANMREFGKGYSKEVVDNTVAQKTYAYSIDNTDNAVLMDIFTFGTYGGLYLGPATYGQLTSFNFDCVTVGIFKDGEGFFNSDWTIAQGSIIANAGTKVEDIHPFIIQGKGSTLISNVVAFSGPNFLTNCGKSQDFMLIKGNDPLHVVATGCRMANYVAADPFTIENSSASLSVSSSIDKDWKPYTASRNGKAKHTK